MKSWLLVGACVAVAAPAHAGGDPDALQKQGEQLAKDGQFAEAIDAFKAADAVRPTTGLACLIGLAYGRRNLYGQAELFFDLCHERAEDGEPVPSWVGKVERQVRERLESSKLARIKITVRHARHPKIVVSAFAPDEVFAPRAIHLPAGRHTITVTDADRESVERAIVVAEGEPQTIVIDLGGGERDEPASVASGPSHLGRNLAIAGLGIAAIGVAVHATWYRSELSELEAAQEPPDVIRYDAHVDAYQQARYVTVGLYAAGAITAGIGLVLHLTRPSEHAPTVSVTPVRGGGVLAVEWGR